MKVTYTANEDILTVAIEGRLDTTTAPDLEQQLKDKLTDDSVVVFDFEKLQYISSAGLRVLLQCKKKLGDNVTFTRANEEVMEILSVTGFKELLGLK